MNILTIDTATEMEIIAVSTIHSISEITNLVGISHSITLFDNIKSALYKLDITINDIDLIGVGIGPGSFTGIRIAVSAARMLAQILNIPLVGIKTHYLYAASVRAAINENILITFDAKKDRVFGALYRKTEYPLLPQEIIAPGDYLIDYLLENINNDYKTLLIGNGSDKYYPTIKNKISDFCMMSKLKPSATSICELTEYIYMNNPNHYTDINNTIPFYMRKSDAEIAMDIRRKDGKTDI
ncbi:MAG: tRNA (adenosine(37)-N6)-threonylcarbamoyltransferase complex dimerization subunit type 1 TsaB [Spirochaetota bacterium]|nr:tRNA (adenosine(37)-N6)-threonylcarbamoyltransferase complex dimerization subunit type 1 TsaB [Spirochaetota bacterium]